MTKEQFESSYCERSVISLDFYKRSFITLPCACGDKVCKGWAAVSKRPDFIEFHNDLYAPKS